MQFAGVEYVRSAIELIAWSDPNTASNKAMLAQYHFEDVLGCGLVLVAMETDTSGGAATGALS